MEKKPEEEEERLRSKQKREGRQSMEKYRFPNQAASWQGKSIEQITQVAAPKGKGTEGTDAQPSLPGLGVRVCVLKCG